MAVLQKDQTRAVLLSGALFAIGATLLIGLTAGRLGDAFDIVGRTRSFIYPWRLTKPQRVGRITAWLGYVLHNLSAWLVIAAAKKQHTGYSNSFKSHNYWMVIIHVVFTILHWIQTHLWYDGLAQDVPEITAIGSVAILLAIVLILEIPNRGLFFGTSFQFHSSFLGIVREYHSYFFAWVLIYNFWFHPCEGTLGHLVGFLYKFLLLWQSVLMFHQTHLNRPWRLSLELLVIPHSMAVVLFGGQSYEMSLMFFFGFASVFVLTQMHGLNCWSSKFLDKKVVYVLYTVSMLAVYWYLGRMSQIHEVLRIPILDYGMIFLLYFIFLMANRALGFSDSKPPKIQSHPTVGSSPTGALASGKSK